MWGGGTGYRQGELPLVVGGGDRVQAGGAATGCGGVGQGTGRGSCHRLWGGGTGYMRAAGVGTCHCHEGAVSPSQLKRLQWVSGRMAI